MDCFNIPSFPIMKINSTFVSQHTHTPFMKKNLLFTCSLLLPLMLFAQQTGATFKNGLDSLVFINGKAVFCLTGFAGLSTAQVGEGSYEQVDHFLLIKTSDYSGPKSAYQPIKGSTNDSCLVKVVGSDNYPLQNILVEARTKSDKVLEGKVSGDDGKAWFKDNDKLEKITVSAMGYDAITIDHTLGKHYLVTMTENNIIENSTVVFSIRTVDDETISLLLLTDDFKESKNRLSDLQKLEKKIRKRNLLEKRLKKVYVPYVRKM